MRLFKNERETFEMFCPMLNIINFIKVDFYCLNEG